MPATSKNLFSKNLTNKEKYILENFPINELYRVGFFKSKTDFKHMEKRICERFGIKNVFMYEFIGCERRVPVKANIDTFSVN